MKKHYLSFVLSILLIGIATLSIKSTTNKIYTNDFQGTLLEVQDFWEDVTGNKVDTDIRPTFDWSIYPNVLAYCMMQPGNKFISFNYSLINEYANNNPAFAFQVILHEYTHCQGSIGHIEMYGHFMNDGGAPWLTKDSIKIQFQDYVDYYNKFYGKYMREEEDLNATYALVIKKDNNGTITIKCPCKACIGLKEHG